MRSVWSPAQYERFKDERTRPFADLVALVEPREGMRVVDLGCGTGETTRALHDALKARETIGLDSSESMLAKSAAFATDGLRFVHARIEDPGLEGPFDLVFSNAALHWVDDHPALLVRLAALVASGGQIAVQVPENEDHPSHAVAAEVAREEPFASALGGFVRVSPTLPVERYAELLDGLGFTAQDVSLRVYAHRLASRDQVIEWVKGTMLTDYEKRLPAELWTRFLARYRERLFAQIEDARPFLYTFKRALFWGKREGRT